MYEFMDRPVASLNNGGRLLIWAMRHWVRAVSAGRCPCGDVGPAFHKSNLMGGFPHFHMLMAILNREALDKIGFGTVDCERVSEHEALLLGMIRTMRRQPAERLRNAAALIVQADAVGHMLIAMSALAQALADANLHPAAPAYDPDRARFPSE